MRAGKLETRWNRIVQRFAGLPWWARALWLGFAAVSTISGVSVTDVAQSALSYQLPTWIPGFIESGVASLILVVVGLVVLIALVLSGRSRHSGEKAVPKRPPREVASTLMRTEIDDDGVERQHATVTPAPIGAGTAFPGEQTQQAEPLEPFDWSDMRADDSIEGYLHDSLILTLSKMTSPKNRWRRGVLCTVRSPDGTDYHSRRRLPDETGQVKLFYPRDFGGLPVVAGVYTVTWHGAASDDPAEIKSRPFSARVVVLSSFSKGRKPESKWVMEESEAKQVVRDGVGNYLQALSNPRPLRDNESHALKVLRDGWAASVGIVAMPNQPRSIGLTLQREDDSVPLIEAYCAVVLEGRPPGHSWPGPEFGSRRSNQFVTFFPGDLMVLRICGH